MILYGVQKISITLVTSKMKNNSTSKIYNINKPNLVYKSFFLCPKQILLSGPLSSSIPTLYTNINRIVLHYSSHLFYLELSKNICDEKRMNYEKGAIRHLPKYSKKKKYDNRDNTLNVG